MNERGSIATVDARRRVLDAFRELMLAHGYRRLTVARVIAHSKVGRATFYTHFRNKDDLLAASVDGLGAFLLGAWETRRAAGHTEPLGFVPLLFAHAGASRGMLTVYAEESTQPVLRVHLERVFARLVRREFELRGAPVDEPAVQFLVGALWASLAAWTRDPRIAAPRAAEQFVELARPVLDAAAARQQATAGR